MRLRKARRRRSSSRLISLPPVERRGLPNSRQASSPGAQSTVCTQRCHACSPGRMAKCGLARPSIRPSNSCGFVVGSCPTFACNSPMHLDLLRDKSKVMPTAADPAAVTSAQIWHCAYSSLEEIAAFPNIHSLVIATFPDTSLGRLSSLSKLTYLRVVHLPKVTDLSPLASLTELRSLSLETLPSWDASSKRTVVASLEPITRLEKIEHLSLLGVVPEDRSLSVLQQCTTLRTARFHGFAKAEVARFLSLTGVSIAHCPEAVVG